MKNFLVGVGLRLATSAVAIVLAAVILPGFHLHFFGFLTAVVVFTVAQTVVAGIAGKMTREHTPIVSGVASLISTFMALLIANGFSWGISIYTLRAWVLATLIVWVVTAAGALILPKLTSKEKSK